MRKLFTLAIVLLVASASYAQKVQFPESIDPGNYLPEEVLLPQSPLSMQILFIGEADTVQTRKGPAAAKQWHDFIGFTPCAEGDDCDDNDLGWVSVNHERIVADDRIGDGGGMTVFKVQREEDGTLGIVEQTLEDGRSGKFFNVDFVGTVGETGMNCAGITSLADGRIWTAEEWFRYSTNSYFSDGNGVRDTTDFTVDAPEFPWIDGQTINKVDNFNYMVEIDPRKAEAIRKQYNWGRQGFEGGVVMPDNKTAYLGEDSRPGLFTRFVADTPGDFTQGTFSYYAYDEENEQGYWQEYEINSLKDAAEMNAYNGKAPFGNFPTAADTSGQPFRGENAAAMFIRNEWVAAYDGRVYWAETGNDGFWDEFALFRPGNDLYIDGFDYNGKIGKYLVDAARFRFPEVLKDFTNAEVRQWLVEAQNFRDSHGRVLCYDPETSQTYVFFEGGPYPGDDNGTSLSIDAGYPEKHLTNPDGLNFITTPQGKTYMIICEDLNGRSFNRVPAEAQSNSTCELWALDMEVAGPMFAQAVANGENTAALAPQFLDLAVRISTTPLGSEVTGAQQTSDGKTLLVNSQHPRTTNPFPFNNSLTYAINGWEKLAELQKYPVIGYELWDAGTDTKVADIPNHGVLEVDNLEGRRFNIFAVLGGEETPGSMKVSLTGPANFEATINGDGPYGFKSNSLNNINGETLPAGSYTINATPFSDVSAGGTEGIGRFFNFELKNADQFVDAWKLIDADTDMEIATITEGAVIAVENLGSRKLSIVAESDAELGSVRLYAYGPTNTTKAKLENQAPYSLIGDVNGNFIGSTYNAGPLTVKAIPYSMPNEAGEAGPANLVRFTLEDATSASEAGVVVENSVSVYPNAFEETINLSSAQTFALYSDVTGEMITSSDVAVKFISTKGLKGTYILKLGNGQDIRVKSAN